MVLARSKTCGSAVVIVQLVALLILQSYFLLPLYRQFFHAQSRPAVCQHDHKLCGCSPARIAAKSCCCSQAVPSCCLTKYQQEEQGDSRVHEDSEVLCSVSTAPCGDTESVVVSPENLKFISQTSIYPLNPFSSPAYGPAASSILPDRSPAPPVPPPRRALAA